MTYDILPEADDEAFDAAARLESARRGYGTAFRLAFDQGIAEILATPDRFPVADDTPPGQLVLFVYLARFRYRILYTIFPNAVLVIAVAHASRRPGYWTDRLP